MDQSLQSMLLAPWVLYLLLLAAIVLTFSRQRPPPPPRGGPTARWAITGVAVQSLHFLEEFSSGFYQAFPAIQGFAPWPPAYFAGVNLVLIVVLLLACIGFMKGQRWAYFPLWFLALALLPNGLAHPLLALISGGYFPGLWSSPLAGITGWLLLTRLIRLTARK